MEAIALVIRDLEKLIIKGSGNHITLDSSWEYKHNIGIVQTAGYLDNEGPGLQRVNTPA